MQGASKWLFAGLAGLNFALPAQAAVQSFTLYVRPATLTVRGAGGATLNVWCYFSGGGSADPTLSVNEGDSVEVTVVNNHTLPHNFVVQNLTSDVTSIAPGGSYTYRFTAAAAGSYVYGDSLNNKINREMGLYGALVVRPADGAQTVWAGGPRYDFERIWVIGDMDKPRWNDVASSGGNVNVAVYKPNFFLINGLGGFDAMANMNVAIDGGVGQAALVRIVNGGQFAHSLHFHGNHFQVVAIDGARQTAPFQLRDTINIPPFTTADVLYSLNQPGVYPMHAHAAQTETANGVYLNGMATMITMQ